MAKEVNDSNFQQEVLSSNVPVLVDFWAPWCGPCLMLGPVIDEIAQEVGDKAKVFKLNVDENPTIASQYGITAIPTVIIFENGEIKDRFIGIQPKETYLQALGV